ncbi:MAG: SMP-30/gluconolactonase/LRE family protein [bacterium]|nr:SMP-30/gluconolactonase/LRE family protein [bacterium]
MNVPRCLWPAGALLGEGPVWCAAEGVVYWVDIKRPRVLRYRVADGRRDEFPMPSEIGCIGLAEGGRLVAALRTGFAFLDLDGGHFEPIADPEADRPGNRFNDGKVDATGRFWAGSMDDAEREPSGCLYRLDRDLSVIRVDEGYVVTNGPAFSPDGRTLYHNDSAARRILAFDCDPVTGALANRRTFAEIERGYPDGLTVDAEGGVWCALWDGWCVVRFTPDGREERSIELPVARVTSCTFGDTELDTLFVTTASMGLDETQASAQPLAGGLFAVRPGLRGLPTPVFARLPRPSEGSDD